uniref:Uncharacterized protein AlNc14C94G5796 n=1 Tax=Albugo laibachii Nc14 TaxID=890382 RepID=F0WGR9_9STRA|nr:conserved hypothetical protein [Albugo laibachii Nc14]|eukprot:CCA20433.1 conserved hypothetical protein [Albugo laibachii Nc14]
MEMETKDIDNESQSSELLFEFNALPPLPPSSDPQRLLTYVLNIVPKYTEMETMASHLRLYTTALEQDVAQLKHHVTTLMRNVAQEEERKIFLERYASQVVKERNDLLHGKQGSRQRTHGGTNSHFVWHTCCKKNNHHVMDVTPSMATLRGDKLHECRANDQQLQLQLAHFEKLSNELRVSLSQTQRDADSKLEAQRKHTQHLEKQILQRSILQSNLERKMYQTEKTLSHFESEKRAEKERLEMKTETLTLEKDVIQEKVNALDKGLCVTIQERDEAREELRASQKMIKQLTNELDSLSLKYTAATGEVEALHSELDLVQSKDLEQVRKEYKRVIGKLREEKTARETELVRTINELRNELSVVQELRKNRKEEENAGRLLLQDPLSPSDALHASKNCSSAGDSEIESKKEDALWADATSELEMAGLEGEDEAGGLGSNHSVESHVDFVNWESFISEKMSQDGETSGRLGSENLRDSREMEEVESMGSTRMEESSNEKQTRELNTRRSLFMSRGSITSSIEEKEGEENDTNDITTAYMSDSEAAFVMSDLQALVLKFEDRCKVEQRKVQVIEQELLELQQSNPSRY